MAGLISSLYTGATGLYTSQAAINVTGNNISNVNTEGYSREVISIASSTLINQGGHLLGTGAEVDSISRAGDVFITEQLIGASSAYGEYEAASEPLSDIEQIIDIDDTSLSSDIDAFFDSWEALSENPDETTERQQVIGEAEALAEKFQQISQELSNVVESINDSLEAKIPELNDILSQVAELNQAIRQAEIAGTNANTLEDQRDLLVQQISEYCGATSFTDEDGMLCMQLENGLPLITADVASSFSSERVNGRTVISLEVGNSSYELDSEDVGGAFKGLLDVRDTTIPEIQDSIDQLAYEIADSVNSLLTTGVDANGDPGTELFSLTAPTDPLADPWEGAAASISVSIDDPNLLAAGTTGLAADNSICLAIGELNNSDAVNGSTFAEEYSRIAARVGVLVSSNEDKLLASEDNLNETLQNRDEIAGVSTDEEMLQLIQYQTGYQAAASYLATVQELLDVMLQLGG